MCSVLAQHVLFTTLLLSASLSWLYCLTALCSSCLLDRSEIYMYMTLRCDHVLPNVHETMYLMFAQPIPQMMIKTDHFRKRNETGLLSLPVLLVLSSAAKPDSGEDTQRNNTNNYKNNEQDLCFREFLCCWRGR